MLANVYREYKINIILLSNLGLWPYQSKFVRDLLVVFWLLIHLSYVSFEIRTLIYESDNDQILFECLYEFIISMAFLTKLLNQVVFRNKFQHLYKTIENHWNVFSSDTEVRVLKHYSALGKQFTIYYTIVVYSMMTLFVTIPSLGPILFDVIMPLNESRKRNIAVYVYYGKNQYKYFWPIFFYSSFMVVVGVSIMIAVDTLHIMCYFACKISQKSYYSKQVENIVSIVRANKTSKNRDYKLYGEGIIYQKYIQCLKKHQLAVEFVNMLDDAHKVVGFSFTIIIGGCFSILGIRIVYVLDQVQELIRYLFIIVGAMLQLLILCYSGQKLMDESQNIFHRAYAAEWYKFSPRLKSLLIITLYRSIIPCRLTAGNIFPLSMTVFAAVVRGGMSYFMAFSSMQE
ncbi:odorant receptor 67a-like [Pseudomyrmex gracilis]|uniref:odorant receptor 67a-like n=1 Tax=Pseudomyrmex gracilis TaxID=219809 RepID=UPI000995120C|nr:odorant receptor 67a-like [Pseudomyrmex gracilis]